MTADEPGEEGGVGRGLANRPLLILGSTVLRLAQSVRELVL